MTASDRFDRDLQTWLDGEASTSAPAGIHDAVIDRARGSRQRPGWLVAVRGGTVGGWPATLARPGLRVAYLLVIAALVLAAVVAVIAAGISQSNPFVGRNGAIVYSVEDFSQQSEGWRSHLMSSEGTDDRPIFYGRCATFSADGTVLAYTSGLRVTPEVWVAAADGSKPHTIPGIRDSEYALSPDGTRIAWFKRIPVSDAPPQAELWVTRVPGGPGVRIVPVSMDPDEIFSSIVWSRDGRQIAFASSELLVPGRASGAYRSAILIVNEDGSGLRKLTTRPGIAMEIGMSWSPDGKYLAYEGRPDGSPIPSVDSEAPGDIFVINADGTEDRNLTTSTDAEVLPAWSPDDTHIAYRILDAEGHLMTLRMDGPVAAGSPFPGPAIDTFVWSPDGTKLLAVTKAFFTNSSGEIQKVRSTMLSVDAEFRRAPTTLVAVDHDIPCAPTWQRLEP